LCAASYTQAEKRVEAKQLSTSEHLKEVKGQFKARLAKDDHEAKYQLALLYKDAGKLEYAKILLKGLIEEDKSGAQRALGEIYLAEGDRAKAEKTLKKAIAKENVRAQFKDGELYYEDAE
jgi:Tfp pilus assembly protein PilF